MVPAEHFFSLGILNDEAWWCVAPHSSFLIPGMDSTELDLVFGTWEMDSKSIKFEGWNFHSFPILKETTSKEFH